MARRAPGALLALGVAVIGLMLSPTYAETVLQLNGETSYVESANFEGASGGIFSMGVWFWPERESSNMEAILSMAVDGKKNAVTVGWVNSGMYYQDPTKAEPVLSEVTLERKTWHYLVLTLDPVDRGVYQDNRGLVPQHRVGTLWVDGVVVMTFETRPPLTGLHNGVAITVGAEYHAGAPRRFFTGLVDEVRVYDTTLNEMEIGAFTFTKDFLKYAPLKEKLLFYTNFNDIQRNDISDVTIKVLDSVAELHTDAVNCEKVHVSVMPYDPIKVYAFERENPLQFATYNATDTGPLSGATVYLKGHNFANTPFLGVYVDTVRGAVDWNGADELTVVLPPAQLEAGAAFADKSVFVCNGGLPGSGQNCASFPFRFQYELGESAAQTEVFYKFEGDLNNAANRHRAKAGVISAGYGDGGPFFAPNRQGYPQQALKFVRGERVETPVLIGDKAEWSLCAWVWAERAARTLYYERDGRKTTVANLVQLDAEGVLYLDGEAGASLTFEAWQFVCITKNATNVGFFVSGVRAASAAPMAVEAEMDKGLIGTNWTGVVDDLWVFSYNMLDYEVMTMYSTEEYSIALDGVAGHLTVTDAGSTTALTTDPFQTGTFTIDMWVKPTAVAGQVQPLLYQASTTPSDAIASKTTAEYDGIYLSLQEGRVVFFTNGAGTTFNEATSDGTVGAGVWSLISVTVGTQIQIYINGQASGPAVTKVALVDSSKPLNVGYGKQDDTFEGTFEGEIGELRIWTKEMPATAYFPTGSTTSTGCPPVLTVDTDLFAYFKLDDAAGSLFHSALLPAAQMQFSGPLLPRWLASNYSATVYPDKELLHMPNSEAFGAGLAYGYIEVENTFRVQLRDECNRLLKFESSPLQVVVGGPLSTHALLFQGDINPNGDGTYTASYSTTMCGFYSIRVEDTTVPLPESDLGDPFTVFSGAYATGMARGSPFKTYVEPGPTVASMSFAYDEPDLLANNDLEVAFYGAASTFLVQAADKYGCPRTKGGDTFEVALESHGPFKTSGLVQDRRDGTYSVTYVPYLAGKAELAVTHKGEHVGQKGPAGDHPTVSCGVSLGSGYGGSPWDIDVQQGDGALQFDGHSCVEAEAEDHLNPGYEFTLEAWVFPMVGGHGGFTDGRLVSKESAATGKGFFVALEGLKVHTSLYVGGSEDYRLSTSERKLAADTWTHVAVTYDGTKVRTYLNGRLDHTSEFKERKDVKSNTQKLRVGKGFRGVLDEVRMTSSAKSAKEVAAGMMCPMESDKVSMYFMFNDGAGDRLWDYSHHANHATMCSHKAEFVSSNAPSGVNVLDWAQTSVDGHGISGRIEVGSEYNFRVDLKDACGFDYAVLDSASVDIGLDNTTLFTAAHGEATCPDMQLLPMGAADVRWEPNRWGVGPMLVSYTADQCGGHDGHALINIKADGIQMPDPLEVYVKPTQSTASAHSVLSGVPMGAVPGLDTSFTITAYDKYGCKRTAGGDTFEVVLVHMNNNFTSTADPLMTGADAASIHPTPVDHGDGTYTVYFQVPAGGDYVLDVGYDDGSDWRGLVPLPGSPHYLHALASEWRSAVVTSGQVPEATYEPTTAVYHDAMYVLGGFASDKSASSSVWKFPLKASAAWAYRALVTVENVDSNDEIEIMVDTDLLVGYGKMRSDCGDVLFLPVEHTYETEPISYYMDTIPGCGAKRTAFWMKPLNKGSFQVYMYYGNVYAAPTAVADPRKIMTSFEDFENSSPFKHGWHLADACDLPAGDAAAFTNHDLVSVTGKKALRVDAATLAGGSIYKKLDKMDTYKLTAYLYDGDAESSAHWISPNFEDCADLDASGDKVRRRLGGRELSGLGVNTCTGSEYMAMLYPWVHTDVPRSCGWKSLEIRGDVNRTYYYIDNELVGERGVTSLDRIVIRGGAPSRPSTEDGAFESVAFWDTVTVGAYNPAVAVAVGAEEAVSFTAASWHAVKTTGTAPPARSTKASVTYAGKVYMPGGFVSEAEEGKVFYYDMAGARWGHKTPFGTNRLSARDDHSLALWGAKIVAFGGRAGNAVLGDVLVYDIADNYWTTVSTAGVPAVHRFGHSAAVFEDVMYVYGGFVNGTASSQMWAFDLKVGEWLAELTPEASPPARFSHTIAVKDGSMFLYGGETMEGVLQDVWRYDFSYNLWREVVSGSAMGDASARSEMGLAVHGNNMLLFGGHGDSAYYGDLWSLNVY
jgi:hypothetical protein